MGFAVPFVPVNTSSWGPPKQEGGEATASSEVQDTTKDSLSKFHDLPYAPFGRGDRIGKVADFTAFGLASTGQGRDGRRGGQYDRFSRFGRTSEENEGFTYKTDPNDEGFELVDTQKAGSSSQSGGKRFMAPAAKRRQQRASLRQLNARRAAANQGAAGGADKDRYNQPQRTRRRNNWGGRGGYGGRGGRGGWRDRVDRASSVPVQTDWTVVEEFELGKLAKLRDAAIPKDEDLLFCGFLDQYNEAYDKVSTKNAVPLKRFETKEFYPVTTTDDPVIEKLAIENTAQVYITDAILSHIMTCPRSVFSWDVVVQKLPDGTLFFDKRDNSQFDFLTVSETAMNPPPINKADDDPEGINTLGKLSLEATSINQNFSQQILKRAVAGNNTRKPFELPNPFFDEEDAEGMEPASVGYRYRKFTFPDGTSLVCRCELHGYVSGTKARSSKEPYLTAFALNEWDPKATSNTNAVNWREKIDTHRGAVLATELKNNSYKVAKWTAQSLLSKASHMKIGYVSRKHTSNNYEHVILATQFYVPTEFASQITLSMNMCWGIFKKIVDCFRPLPEGKYLILRDPNKPVVRIYSVPPGTFEEDDDEED